MKHIQKRAQKDQESEIAARRETLIKGGEVPASLPEVGLWWLYDGNIFRLSVPFQNAPVESDLDMIDDQHIHAWPQMRQFISLTRPDVVSLRYNEPERGRVWFKPSEKKFIITCSKDIQKNQNALREIMKRFGVTAMHRLVVINDPQYDVRPSDLVDTETRPGGKI